MAKAPKFYVVWRGRKPGIYTTWDDCRAQTDGFPNARFKSFPTKGQAEQAYSRKPSNQRSPGPGARVPRSPAAVMDDIKAFNWAFFCDGGCYPNPGPSGTGLAIYHRGDLKALWAGGHEPEGTNNRAELFGLLQAFRHAAELRDAGLLTPGQRAVVCCDSQYAIDCVTKWCKGWQKRGWKTQSGDPVKNQDLIEQASQHLDGLSDLVSVRKVKGHSGVEGNELADQLAGAARDRRISGWEALDAALLADLTDGQASEPSPEGEVLDLSGDPSPESGPGLSG